MKKLKQAKTVEDQTNKKYVRINEEALRQVQGGGAFYVPHVLGPEPREFPVRQFFIFREIGDSIEGVLGKGIVNFRRNQSYPITVENGEVWEIFANRWLHRIIHDNELFGAFIKVTYVGLRHIHGYSRSQKIYDVHKVTFGDEELQTSKPKRAYTKKAKVKK